jgi:uncharacterized alpha-E superfamily protein
MLSRVAESLYWTARYVERAEVMSRIVHVNFHTLLDSGETDADDAWRRLLALGGVDDLFRRHHDAYTAEEVAGFMLRSPRNPNAVTACIARARENARGARDQLTSEMWEELNRLHLYLASSRMQGVIHAQHQLFVHVREASHGFAGMMEATLPRGEGYDLLRLGAHIERADVTARILLVQYPSVASALPDTLGETVGVNGLLRSCGAFEAFRKSERSEHRASRVLEYLLLDRGSPRTVLFCLDACLGSLERIAGPSDRPERAIGRLTAELAFLDAAELHGPRLRTQLDRSLEGIASAGDEIASTFFTTRALVPGAFAHAQQQQQQ